MVLRPREVEPRKVERRIYIEQQPSVSGDEGLTRGERAIKWCEDNLRIPEGKFYGQPLKMAEFMKDDFKAIYDSPHGTRRVIITRGRKNAKTVETAMLLLLHLCSKEARRNSQLYSTAQSREQAAIVFDYAAKMVRLSPMLSAAVVIRDTAKQLVCPELGTVYRALSAESTTAFGLSPILTIHDELGQVRGPRSTLYEAMETATAAQEEPLTIIISTQAATDADLLSILIDDAKNGSDPKTVLRMQTAPVDLDPFSVEAIKAANPAFEIFMNKQEVLAMAEDARRMPSREAEYRLYVLNQRVEASAPFISRSVWRANGAVPKPFAKDTPLYAGLDLSAVDDLTALVLVGKVDGIWQVHPTFWLPADGLRERARTDRVPYDVWHKQGKLETVPGRSVDYEYVARWIRELFEHYEIKKVGFDRWKFESLKSWLLKVDFSEQQIERHFVEVGQGFQAMTPALRNLEAELLNNRLAHGNHPVLTMCMDNAVVQIDPAGNRKLNKQKSIRRIDGAVALAMAFGVADLNEEPEPKYQFFAL